MRLSRRKTVSNNIDKFKAFTEGLEKLQAARQEAFRVGTSQERLMINIAIEQLLRRATGYVKPKEETINETD